jgi:hypothetical protein
VAVAGQLLDYVELLEQSGVSNAVAMLHTGKRAAVVARAPGGDRKLQMTAVATTAPDVAKLTLQYLRTANALSISAPVVDFSRKVDNRLVRYVTLAGTIRWQQMSTSGLCFRAVPKHDANAQIVLWTELGRGAFGSCFLASIGDRAFALKVLHSAPLAAAPSSSILLTADEELANIKAIYTKANGWSDAIVDLFAGSWAMTRDRLSMLAMPLCTAVSIAQRAGRLADVKEALEKLARGAIVYRLGDDFGWRHVMTLHTEVVFVDFGLLVPLASTALGADAWVGLAMQHLRETIDNESQSVCLGAIASHSSNESSSEE